MMDPVLPPACYTQQSWFELEREKIFGQLWLFAGLTQQLQSENSFITRELNGIPVLIQKIDGELRAFRNACAHRGMPIQIDTCGNRKLVCPYHAWSYRSDGQLRGVPNSKIYNMCEKAQSKISLQIFPVEVIGNFVFVNLNPDPIAITEQFSDDLLTLLREVSPHFSHEVSYTTFAGEYNWKLNFENVLDWNHAPFVHKQTLAPLLSIERGGEFSAASPESSLLFKPGSPLANIRFSGEAPLTGKIALKDISRIGRSHMPYTPRWFSKLLENSVDIGAFFACNLFPNVNFGSIHGEHFYLQQFVPTAPGQVEYHSWVFTAKLKADIPPQPHLLWGIHHAEKRVIDEDVVLLNALQKALNSASTIGVMGDHEAPLAAVGHWYMQHLTTENTP